MKNIRSANGRMIKPRIRSEFEGGTQEDIAGKVESESSAEHGGKQAL